MATQETITPASAQGVATLPVPSVRPQAISTLTGRRRARRTGLVISYIILIIAVLFALYPVYFAFLVSIRPNGQLLSLNLVSMFLPTDGVTLDYYSQMLHNTKAHPFLSWLGNSLFVALSTSIASVFLATSAAFAISRIKFRGRNGLLILFLAIQAFPGVLALGAILQLLTALAFVR